MSELDLEPVDGDRCFFFFFKKKVKPVISLNAVRYYLDSWIVITFKTITSLTAMQGVYHKIKIIKTFLIFVFVSPSN